MEDRSSQKSTAKIAKINELITIIITITCTELGYRLEERDSRNESEVKLSDPSECGC